MNLQKLNPDILAAWTPFILIVAVGCGGDQPGSLPPEQPSDIGNPRGTLGPSGPGPEALPSTPASPAAQNRSACSPAPELFDRSLCLCGDFRDVGDLRVGTTSSQIPRVGVNGTTKVINHTDIRGSWLSWGAARIIGDFVVDEDMETHGGFDAIGRIKVLGDLFVGGNLMGAGSLTVEGELAVAGSDWFIGDRDVASRGAYAAAKEPPCACEAGSVLDVAKEVSRAKEEHRAGILPPISLGILGHAETTLKSGRYFVTESTAIGQSIVRVAGNVILYLDGSLKTIGHGKIVLSPGASVDLYVSGDVAEIGRVGLAGDADPAAFRLYVGGTSPTVLAMGDHIFTGTLYAPTARVEYVGYTRIEGALFAQELGGTGKLDINYQRPVHPPGSACGNSDPSPQQPPADQSPPPHPPVDPGV